jgi:hypothetical protein
MGAQDPKVRREENRKNAEAAQKAAEAARRLARDNYPLPEESDESGLDAMSESDCSEFSSDEPSDGGEDR